MSLTRKMLKAMGIEEEKIDQIIEAHSETVDSLKADRDTYKEDAEKLKTVQKELDDLKAKGDDGWKEKHDKLKGASDHIKAAKEEWAEYVTTTTTTGAKTSTPPANTGGSVKTKEEIYKMENGRYVLSASERQAELAKLYQHEKGE